MKHLRNTVAICLLAAIAGVASAQAPRTRAEVEAELAAAMRNGEMLSPAGIPYRNLRPDLYPQPAASTLTRAQVRADLASAIRNGDMQVAGDSALREKDLAPGNYPADPVVAGKTRQQVESELAVAIHNGDMLAPGELGVTERQLEPSYYAQQRAADATLAAHTGASRTFQ
jgi:hypothetical protein